MLLPLPFALDQLEEDDLLDRDMADNEEELTELEDVTGVLTLLALRLCTWAGVLLILVHRVRVRLLLRRLVGLTTEDATRKILDETAAENVGAFAQSVHGVDGLLSHGEPLLGPARTFNGILELPEKRVLHIQPKGLVEERA